MCDADTTGETDASSRGRQPATQIERKYSPDGFAAALHKMCSIRSLDGKSASKCFGGSFVVADWPSTRNLFLPGTTRAIQTPSETKQNKFDALLASRTTHRRYKVTLLCVLPTGASWTGSW